MEGFYRVAAAVPRVRVADIEYNVGQIRDLLGQAAREECALVVFPELGLTGYTCADLFFQSQLLDAVQSGLDELRDASTGLGTVLLVGAPLRQQTRLYNCAVLMQNGNILGVVPKTFIPNYKEYYEKRWFSSGLDVVEEEIAIGDEYVPFGTDLLFEYDEYFTLGVELCEDLWNVVPPSSYQALAGATVLANLAASNELVGKADYRRGLIMGQSARCVAGYVYGSSGVGESSTDLVFGGHALIAENGIILAQNDRFQRENSIIYAELDCQRLCMTRLTETSFADNPPEEFQLIQLDELPALSQLKRRIDPQPFVPEGPAGRDERCGEIFKIQAAGLARRLEHTGSKHAIVGISGGLDSTLALLASSEAMKLLGKSNKAIMAVTMPGFGTSDRTHENAVKLGKQLGTNFREINIKAACEQHFKDIAHDPEKHDITYENAQARERMQILMDLANEHGGLVVGTGDLSEIALGWCTYGGDHMSMYAVNCGVPKTLVRYIIQWVAEQRQDVQKLLLDILETPITPELLPTGQDGEIAQQTETLIGPYELHDFFLYHALKYGAAPARIRQLAQIAFKDQYGAETIEHTLSTFIKRFFTQQFKRSCVPDGPKVGTISLSPRGDWRMPSDAANDLWLKDIPPDIPKT